MKNPLNEEIRRVRKKIEAGPGTRDMTDRGERCEEDSVDGMPVSKSCVCTVHRSCHIGFGVGGPCSAYLVAV